MQEFRLAAGGRIDRGRRVRFRFDGRPYEGFAGDTLASALLANGVHLVGRSFKYHRPRGVLSAGSEEPNALVTVDCGHGRYTPNLRATQIELYDGLVAESQNRFASLRFDVGALADLVAPVLPAGFYYKTFMWPRGFWAKWYEPLIRRAAGLGRAPAQGDPDRYASRYAHCDVLVVGAGPAGLAAAVAAASAGAQVILCDEQNELGGQLLGRDTGWAEAQLRLLRGNERVMVLPRTTAFGYYADNFLGLAERLTDHVAAPGAQGPRERLWQVRAGRVVLATGAIERPLVFPGNDRPGIMLAGAAAQYATRYGVRPGRRVVIVADCDSAYESALALHEAGVTIVLVADLRPAADGVAARAVLEAGLRVRSGMVVRGTQGRLRVASIDVAPAEAPHAVERIGCDLVAMSGGWTPSVHLFSQSRGRLRYSESLRAYVPGEPAQRVRSAGACRGVFETADCIGDGMAAGLDGVQGAVPEGVEGTLVAGSLQGRAFVDFQNDVTAKDLLLATREGFRSIEHVKRYTTTGMATDQGKTSNLNAIGIVAGALGISTPAVGLTSFRPPFTPVTFGTLAGAARGVLFEPVRTTPMHDWAGAQGAVFEDVGAWKRARYFPRGGEAMEAAVARECRVTRERVGLFDGSTLGKIEVVGPDAATFLNRMYVNAFTRLAPGGCRYGIMLGENGCVLDDGVIGRISATRFHVTTTTGGAARVLGVMEDYLQTEWPDLRVWLTSTTEQWAVMAVQGPAARDVLAPLVLGIDLAPAAMPHMSLREGRILGVPLRLFRVSFTGEMGFEVNVPAGHGEAVMAALWLRVQAAGGTLYGTEAMHVLRAEKGYIIVGQETDGTVTPDDLGLGWAIGRSKPDFVGKRSLALAELARPGRRQLVGLLADDPAVLLDEGAQIVAMADPPAGTAALGHVTSAYASARLGRGFALGLLEGGRGRHGEMVHVQHGNGTVAARVTGPVFHDPEGRLLDG